MLKQLFNIPNSVPFILACSGGVDSMAVADFYCRGSKKFEVAYFNHGTPQASLMEKTVVDWAWDNEVVSLCGYLEKERPRGLSPEEHFRDERYAWLQKVSNGRPIVTCHHLNDVCETWIFSALHGNPKIISPVAGGDKSILRPFLTTTKQDMISWCKSHGVSWFEDTSNADVRTPRNRIRHNIMKDALEINPGLHKVMKKKVISEYQNNPVSSETLM
jgi:tRNA(Ile)-lysidine synthase